MIWFLILLVALAATPIVIEARRKPIDRKAAPGKFADLSQGTTHYQWLGPVRGPVIVAIHGISTPSPAWYSVAEGLGRLGYRVLVYDLYGRGYSDAVPGAQNRAFFLRQLDDLLASQGLAEDLTLIGYSMGGAIATAFAASEPERMKRLILVAPSGIKTVQDPFTRFCARTPVLGDWLWGTVGGWRIAKDMAAHRDKVTEVPGIVDIQAVQLRRKGYLPALLASRRGILSETMEAEHRKIGHDDIPTVALWGDQDTVIPLAALGTLTQWNRLVRQEVVKGADHWLPMTHGAEVAETLRDILREQ